MKIRICGKCRRLMPAAAGYCGSCGAVSPAAIDLTEEQELSAVRSLSGTEPVKQSGKYRLMSIGMWALPAFYTFFGAMMLYFVISSYREHLAQRRKMEHWRKVHFPNSSLGSSTDSGSGFVIFWCVMVVLAIIAASVVSFLVLRHRRGELVREYEGREKAELFRFRQKYAAVPAPAVTAPASPAAEAVGASRVERLSFASIYEANCALAQMSDVSDISVNYETATAYGLIANHSDLRELSITAVRTGRDTGTVCQIADHEYTRLYLEDRSNMADKLQALNPHVRIVSVKSVTNSRGQAGLGMTLGIGVTSHRHVFVLYRVRRDQPAAISF